MCAQCASVWVWESESVWLFLCRMCQHVLIRLWKHAGCLYTAACVCVSMCWVRASCRCMCAGTSTWRPCLTGPQCVRPDAKPTWQKQIMSAPVIFSSPSAPQEPFKGPNTDEITHTHMHTHACIQYSVHICTLLHVSITQKCTSAKWCI